MIKTKLGIDKILTINLPKRKDRRKSFNDKFQTMEFDFVDAVDGSKLIEIIESFIFYIL